jgi:hypothetical protein
MPSDHDDLDADEKKSKSKKRKRESEPTKGRKGSVKKDKEPRKKSAAGKRKNGTKSKDMVESEDDGAGDEAEGEAEVDGQADDDNAGPSKKTSPPPTKKVKRDKEEEVDDGISPPWYSFTSADSTFPALSTDPEAGKVRDWRHKLQKAFLSKTVPTVSSPLFICIGHDSCFLSHFPPPSPCAAAHTIVLTASLVVSIHSRLSIPYPNLPLHSPGHRQPRPTLLHCRVIREHVRPLSAIFQDRQSHAAHCRVAGRQGAWRLKV